MVLFILGVLQTVVFGVMPRSITVLKKRVFLCVQIRIMGMKLLDKYINIIGKRLYQVFIIKYSWEDKIDVFMPMLIKVGRSLMVKKYIFYMMQV